MAEKRELSVVRCVGLVEDSIVVRKQIVEEDMIDAFRHMLHMLCEDTSLAFI
jgi:hypothetical protein